MKLPRSCILFLGLGLGLAALACGKSKKLRPDTVPPGPVRDLTATVLGSDTIRLRWTAPGDDGASGKATAYELGRASSPIAEAAFVNADTVGGLPAPAPAGAEQQALVTGLPGSSSWYFALRAKDEMGNSSQLVAIGPVSTPPDTIPPGPVTNLTVVSIGDSEAVLSWTAPGDDGMRGTASRLVARYIGGKLNDVSWQLAHEASLSPARIVKPGTRQTSTLTGIPCRVLVELALRVFDEANGGSSIVAPVVLKLRGAPRMWNVRQDEVGDAATIQAAIDSSMDNDTILVSDGTYYERIAFHGKAISVVSQNGPSSTAIDAEYSGSAVSFNEGEGRGSVLAGFTIMHGSGTVPPIGGGRVGGGVYCSQSSPTIRNNTITECLIADRSGLGGGVYIGDTEGPIANPLVVDNLITQCTSKNNGGGIAIWGASAEIRNNVLEDNSCSFDGGGIFGFADRGQIKIEKNTFAANSAGDHGGGVHLLNFGRRSEPSLIRWNVFNANTASGLDHPESRNGAGGGLSLTATAGAVEHNTFWGNKGEAPGYVGGGAILLYATTSALVVQENLICASLGGGVALLSNASGQSISNNLFWENGEGNWDSGICGECDTLGIFLRNLVADPLFCNPEIGDLRIQSNSPARTSSGVRGALAEACGMSRILPGEREQPDVSTLGCDSNGRERLCASATPAVALGHERTRLKENKRESRSTQ